MIVLLLVGAENGSRSTETINAIGKMPVMKGSPDSSEPLGLRNWTGLHFVQRGFFNSPSVNLRPEGGSLCCAVLQGSSRLLTPPQRHQVV